ncbi:primosomal protein N' [Candidatus Babeliales bacterium]|nr:primosomal protein N' [Candidatus Babeliales bacterium]
MFVQVKLLKGYTKILTYKIPESWETNSLEGQGLEGSVITVPLRNKIVPALVLKTYSHRPEPGSFEIKLAIARDHLPPDKLYKKFLEKVSRFYFVDKKLFYQRIRGFVSTTLKLRRTAGGKSSAHPECLEKPCVARCIEGPISLTQEQQQIVDEILPLSKNSTYTPILIHGVTGSGKTEIYKKMIAACVEQKNTVLLLLPEVSLALQFQRLLEKQLPNIQILGFHSASRAKEKRELWSALHCQQPILIIGVHLPAMLPIPNLGCIIVDEEHETGFQEKKHPKINSKEIALWRAKEYEIPIILGSATPSIATLYQAEKDGWKSFRLTKRFSGKLEKVNFPTIKTVKIDKTRRRQSFWITRELQNAINDRLTKKEQILIFINRRGYSFFVQCKQCSYTFLCPNCSVSLTLHQAGERQELRCHYCDYKRPNPTSCSECKAPEKELLKRGIGTQQVVTILEQLFPNAKIARADLDTTKKKRSWHETVEKFENGDINILVGTQTITKGYHFPHVTLVGIVWADLNAHFPVFNASETALQQLIQVAGRAGRQSKESLVIVQIMHEHPIFKYLHEEDYLTFCREELSFRKETSYPPYGRLVQIELKHTNRKTIEEDASRLYDILDATNTKLNLGITLLGPTQPPVYRIQKIEIRQIFLKASSFQAVHHILGGLEVKSFESQIFVVPTP